MGWVGYEADVHVPDHDESPHGEDQGVPDGHSVQDVGEVDVE